MRCSNPNVNPDLVKDPLLEPYNLEPGALDPQEIECRNLRKFLRNRRTFSVDISN